MISITKPEIDKIVTDVKKAMRTGVYTVYDVIQLCANGVNACIDWVNTNGSILKDNEDARITAETARADEFSGWKTLINGWKSIFNDKADKILDISASAFNYYNGKVRLQGDSIDGVTQNTLELPVASSASGGTISKEDYAKFVGSLSLITSRQKEDTEGDYLTIKIEKSNGATSNLVLYPATTNYAGLMSSDDKDKLDGISTDVTEKNYYIVGNVTTEKQIYTVGTTGMYYVGFETVTAPSDGTSGFVASVGNTSISYRIEGRAVQEGSGVYALSASQAVKLLSAGSPSETGFVMRITVIKLS